MATIVGNRYDNYLIGTSEHDSIQGYSGNDIIFGLEGADYIFGGDGTDTLWGFNGNDTLSGGVGGDLLYGEAGSDKLLGENGADRLSGGAGDDILLGGGGRDVLLGGAGDDMLQGGSGNDLLNGGAGNDFVVGGAGADTFVLGLGFTTINDFTPSDGDIIDLRSALANYIPDVDDLSDFVQVSRNTGIMTTNIAIDANGLSDGVANFVNVGLINAANYSNLNALLNEGSLLVPLADTSSDPWSSFSTARGDVSSLMDFLGVCIKILPDHAVYKTGTAINNSLDYLNISNIRVGAEAPINNNQTAPVYDALADHGIKFDFLIRREAPNKGDALLADYVQHFKSFLEEHPGSINSIEGLNEVSSSWNLSYNGLSGKPAAVAYQQALYTAINSDNALKDIPVYNFTVYNSYVPENTSGYADMLDYSDAANAHTYIASNLTPYYELQNRLDQVKVLDSNSPAVITEMGYPSNALPGNTLSVDQPTQAKLVLNMIMNAYEQRVPNAYIYELFDAASNKPEDIESNFGLFTANGAPKPAATAVHNLTEILYRDTGSGATSPLKYDLMGEDHNTHAVALEKSGGVTDLVIWREQRIWDYNATASVPADPQTIQVALDHTARYVDVYDPIAGTSVQQHFTNTNHISMQITDHPIILEIGL